MALRAARRNKRKARAAYFIRADGSGHGEHWGPRSECSTSNPGAGSRLARIAGPAPLSCP